MRSIFWSPESSQGPERPSPCACLTDFQQDNSLHQASCMADSENLSSRGELAADACGSSWCPGLTMCLRPPKELRGTSGTWKLGYSIGSELYWEEFDSAEEAAKRYDQLWWSKVLFASDGSKVTKCSTAVSDPKGIGVAKLILFSRGQRCGHDDPKVAIENGQIPFIPPERLPGVSQAIQLFWDSLAPRVISRNSLHWLYGDSLCYYDVDRYPGVQGYVALTIDDAPGRLGNQNSMMLEVQELLKRHQAWTWMWRHRIGIELGVSKNRGYLKMDGL